MSQSERSHSPEAVNISIHEEKRLLDKIATGNLAVPVRAALAQLATARHYARDVQCDPWEFAVEIERLLSLGATAGDLRWLVKKGYIQHADEVTRSSDITRRFERRANLAFSERSCFLLADGVLLPTEPQGAIVFSDSDSPRVSSPASKPSPRSAPSLASEPVLSLNSAQRPYWDADDRTLYVGNLIVKEYRVRSPNQEAVLSAFEEEQWPHYIDDPLSPVADQSPKQRLRDTIKCLNANQRNQLIRFRGDGTGERVRWELFESSR